MEFVGGDTYQDMWDLLVLGQFTYTPNLLQFRNCWVFYMLICEILGRTLSNSCWLSCWIPSVYLIHVFRLFFELDLLGIQGNNDPKYLRKAPWSLEGLEMKNGGRKSRILVYRGWGTAPRQPERPNLASEVRGQEPHASQSAKDVSSPHFFPSFRTSF